MDPWFRSMIPCSILSNGDFSEYIIQFALFEKVCPIDFLKSISTKKMQLMETQAPAHHKRKENIANVWWW